MSKQRGFTLLELLVALSILVILAVEAIPSLRSLLTQNRLQSASETFVQELQATRSEALKRGQNVYLSLQAGSSWCYGSNSGSSCSCNSKGSCGLSSISGGDYTGVTTTINSGFSNGSIYFDWVRGIPNQAMQVSFQTDSETMKVSMNALGQITVCSTNLGGYPTC